MFPNFQYRADDRLIRRYIDGGFSSQEFEAFQARLKSDAQFRRRYVELIELETGLHDLFEVVQPLCFKGMQRSTFFMRRWKWGMLSALAVCLVFAVLLFPVHENKIEVDTNKFGQDSEISHFLAYHTPLKTDCAVIVSSHEVDNPELKVGRRLQSGLLKLTAGRIQLEFFCGAKVALLAPCQLEIHSERSAKLLQGSVTANLPERAAGFVINSPQATVLDLGTEFNMTVSDQGHSDVAVVNGSVDLSAIGEDGNTIRTRRLYQEEVVRVDSRHQISEQHEIPSSSFPGIETPLVPALNVNEEYVAAVKSSLPDIYWRFESTDGDYVRNEISNRFYGKIIYPEFEPSTLTISGHVRFSKSVLPRYIFCEEPFENLNLGSFSIEMWMCPDDLAHTTCFSTIPTTSHDGRQMMNLIDVATNTWMTHDPGSIRFLHRYPPHLEYPEGYNVFTRGVCAPSQWQHIVAVRSQDRIEIFHNGQKYGSVEIGDQSGEGDFRLLLGQLNLVWTHRQFNGAIDEFAFYIRALEADEIREHYQLMKK